MSLSKDNSLLYLATSNNHIVIIDTKTKMVIKNVEPFNFCVEHLCLS